MSKDENVTPMKRKAPPEEDVDTLYVPLKKRRKMQSSNVNNLLASMRSNRPSVSNRRFHQFDQPSFEIVRKKKKKKKKKKKRKKMITRAIEEEEEEEFSIISFRKGSSSVKSTTDKKEEQNDEREEEMQIYGPKAKKSLLQLVMENRKTRPKMSVEEREREQEQKLLETVSMRRSLIPSHQGLVQGSSQIVPPPPQQNWGWSPPSYIQKMTPFEKSSILNFHKISVSPTINTHINPCLRWEDLRLPKHLCEGLRYFKLLRPTPVQSLCIPIVLQGKDLIGISYTGSGKTMVFLIPMLIFSMIEEQRLRVTSGDGPFSLVLCPNRELARQTYQIFLQYAKLLYPGGDLNCLLCMGGTSFVQMDRVINKGLHAIVATPGRLIHLLEMKKFHLKSCRLVVLDEADRLVDLGFEKSIRTILDYLEDQKRQTLLISATMPPKIQTFAQSALRNPMVVNVGRPGASSMSVTQHVEYIVDVEDRDEHLLEAIQKTGPPVLVFARDKMTVEHVYEFLLEKEVNVAAIHGSKDQMERDYANESFREGKKDILVATDMASKGLDFKNVQHVINYDIPNEIENYVHRIGRTGRWGSKGLATSFICFEKCDLNLLLDLKYLLLEAKQEVPDFLMKLEDTNDEDMKESGCSYCGGLGHRITNCNKLMRDARKNLRRIQNEGEVMTSEYDFN